MNLAPHDFRTPVPLSPGLRASLTDWLPRACVLASRRWTARVFAEAELQPGGLTELTALSLLDHVPDRAVCFHARRAGSADLSTLLVPRALLLAMLGRLLGEEFNPAEANRDLTSVEEGIADYVAEHFFLEPLTQTWPLDEKLRLEPARLAPGFAPSVYSPRTPLLAARFQARGAFGDLEWWWVVSRGRWLDPAGGANPAPEGAPGRGEREAFVRGLPLRLTANLGTAKLSLVQLAALRAGDVLVLDQRVDQPLAATLGGRVKFLVWPGARSTRQAVAIHAPVESRAMPSKPEQPAVGSRATPAEMHEVLDQLAASVSDGDPGRHARLTEVLTRAADFLQLCPTPGGGAEGSIDFLLDVAVPLTAELGHTTLPIAELLELQPGSVVGLDREVSQPVDLTVGGTLFARGEVVVVEDRFAVRIKEIIQPRATRGGR